MTIPLVTIDGPSGVGKGTVCERLARSRGWHFMDSGVFYRLLGYAATRDGIPLDDTEALVAVAESMDMDFVDDGDCFKVLLDGEAVGSELRTETAGAAASQVASQPAVRSALLQRQRDCYRAPGLVADGRDMGTVVFPDAPIKFFLDASAAERARRRHKQLLAAGENANLDSLLREIEARDHRDRNRKVAPLVPAQDAQLIDTTELDVDAVFARVDLVVDEWLADQN